MLYQNKKHKTCLVKMPCDGYHLWLGIILVLMFPSATVYAEVSPELLEKYKSICYEATSCYEGIETALPSKILKCDVIEKECEKLLNLKLLPLVSEEYKQSISAPVWPGVWETDVDAAINWGNGKLYFFKNSEYIRFDIAANKADPGYPRKISSSTWPGLWTDGVDAAVNWGNGKAYFFKGNHFIQYDVAEDRSDSGYPKIVDGKSWPGIWSNGFDTVTNWGNGKAYFFKGNEYVSFDINEKLSDPGYPKIINDTSGILWSGMADDVSNNNRTILKSPPPPRITLPETLLKEIHVEEKSKPLVSSADTKPGKVLFDGSLGENWNELAAFGGNFKNFARIENKVLVVDVPEGNRKGKTGIRSAEPLIKIPEKEEKLATKLTFLIDPDRSSDFILAIIPSSWDGNLEWRSHHIRVGLESSEDENNSSLALWINKNEVMKTNLKPRSLEQISIIVRPDRLVLVTDGTDTILLQGYFPDNLQIHKDGYRISALARTPKDGMKAKLALKEIVLERATYERVADLSEIQNTLQRHILFDGKIMGHRWAPYLDAEVNFDDIANLSNGYLNVDIPDNKGRANAGIQSSAPVIWLDKFGKDSKREILFDFIPTQTTGFAIALSNKSNHFVVKWFKDSGKGKAFIQIYQSTSLSIIDNWHSKFKPVWEKEVNTTAPKQLKLGIEPDGITLSGDQFDEHYQAWPFLQANAGYFLYCYSFPTIPDQPVKMALKEISLDNKILKPVETTKVALGIEPLPISEKFSGEKREGWQTFKKPVDACDLNELGFSVTSIPENKSSTGCDIHTEKKLVNIDRRIDTTNYQLSAQFDPKKTKNFRIVVTPHKRRNWNKYYQACYLNLLQSKTRQNVFSFNCGASKYWQRSVTTEWLSTKWNGRVNILINKDWMQAELEDGVKIRIPSTRLGELYVYFVAPDSHHKETSAELLLTKLTAQWAAPEGMTIVDRWSYIDEKDFNPEQYLKDLKNELRR